MKKAIVFILVTILASSCATRTMIEYRDRDVNKYITNTIRDTLIHHSTDSVYFEVVTKGDTVFKTKYKERTVYRDKVVERRDTCWRDSIDTQYKEKVKEVIKIPKIYYCAFVVSLIIFIFALVKLLRWLKIIRF